MGITNEDDTASIQKWDICWLHSTTPSPPAVRT